MTAILRILTALAVPLAWLNALGGVVAGIWLAILGKWGIIGWGFGFMLFPVYGLSLDDDAQNDFLSFPAGCFFERGPA